MKDEQSSEENVIKVNAAMMADAINEKSPADQLRLAAQLIEQRVFDVALVLVERIAGELHLVIAATGGEASEKLTALPTKGSAR